MAAPAEAAERVPVVWLGESRDGSVEARRTLDAWARSRGLVLESPRVSTTLPAQTSGRASTAGDDVERALAVAREALVALDGDGAERALTRAETTLRATPELAEAAWLMAETQRGWAARFARIEPRDAARAARAWRRAAALDGGRVVGIGEVGADGAEADASVTLVLDAGGARALATGSGYVVAVDGARRTFEGARATVASTAGEHHVRVTRSADGAVAWAGWLTFEPSATLQLPLPAPPPCDAADLAAASRGASDAAVDASAVRCPRWVAAIATAATADASVVRVALCAGSRCEPLTRYPAPLADASQAPNAEAHGGLAKWATWGLVGVGVAALATGTVLVATGAFRTSPPAETRFVGGGVHTSSLGPRF